MKVQFPSRFGMTLAVVGVSAIGLCTMAFRAQADEWDKKTVLTVDQPIQVQDTYLEPGTYVFKLLNSSSDRHIVQIYNRDQNHLINTIMAIPNYRLQPTGDSRFSFYETPPGTARAMHAWFYPGDNFGQEFRYPKNLKQLEIAQVIPAPSFNRPPEPPPAPVATQPAPTETAPQQAAVTEQPIREEPRQEETLVAQNNPPPAPALTPVPEPEPTQLPQTATPYPFIGMLGLISLAGYALASALNR